MRKTLATAVVMVMLVAMTVPAMADEATVRHREGTFNGDTEVSLCNGDTVKFEGDWHYRWTSVRNDNGSHFTQLTHSDGPRFGVSTITGQQYKIVVQSPIISNHMDNQDVEFIMFANSHYIAQGNGPEHGIVQFKRLRDDWADGPSWFVTECKAD